MEWLEDFKKLNPSSEAIEWVRNGKFKTLEQAWIACNRGDWMLSYWAKHHGPITPETHKELVVCASEIARKLLDFNPKGENRPLRAIEAAEVWAQNPTEENKAAANYAAKEVLKAGMVAWPTEEGEIAWAAGAAARAAAEAVESAVEADAKVESAAKHAAFIAAKSPWATRYAADIALKETADIVRKHLPCPKSSF